MPSLSLLEKITLAVICYLSPMNPVNHNPVFQWSAWLVYVKFRVYLTTYDTFCLDKILWPIGKHRHSSKLVIFSVFMVTKKRHPEIPAGQRRLCGYDTWHCTAGRETVVPFLSHADNTVTVTSLCCQRAERYFIQLFLFIPVYWASRSERTHCCGLLCVCTNL